MVWIAILVPSASAQEAAQAVSGRRPLITQPVDDLQLTTLKGNTHPLARPAFDLGTAQATLPMERMLLVLKRSPEQETALRKLLDDQQDKASPSYHKWLTPEQYGQQFGPTDADMQTITTWLQSHGFQVGTTKGRTVLEFSGSASQVQEAFHTTIHKYSVKGEQHWANASDPKIPTALTGAVAGISSLNNFARRTMNVPAGVGTRDQSTGKIHIEHSLDTFPQGCVQNLFDSDYCSNWLAPYDFATIYNVLPLWNSGIKGTGQTIAIVGESNINLQDVATFRSSFGLPVNNPTVTLNGPDPGIQGDEPEANIDVQWSGAVAPNATINFVVSQSTETTPGTDLSAVYIVENNLAPVMSESYGECELGLGTAGNLFYNTLWQQASAQGITVFISSGDNGAAGCDAFDVPSSPAPAHYGLQVSGYASTPYNVAVGGTDFNQLNNPGTYWKTTNDPTTQASALSYIPETTWNDSCTNAIWVNLSWGSNAEAVCNNAQLNDVVPEGGSGGVSNCSTPNGQNPANCAGGYAKPSWQAGPGVSPDGKRDLPDVSLFASNGFLGSAYIICEADLYGPCPSTFVGFGGTSVSSPAFAGIMALVNQQYGRQGNANYVLYKLAAKSGASCASSATEKSGCIFNDVTTGTIAMPCTAGSPNCVTNVSGHEFGVLSGYDTGTGYDRATGLGSVNANNLVTLWNTVTLLPSKTTLSSLTPSTITHGQAVNFTATVAPQSGTGTPTGTLSLEGGPANSSAGIAGFNLTSGAVSGNTDVLPGGTYSVIAHYPGDSTYGPSDSTPLSVTVNKENSSAQVFLVTFNSSGQIISANANTAAYGSPYIFRADIENAAGQMCTPVATTSATGCPTGSVTLTDNGTALDGGTFALNGYGYVEDQTIQLPGGTNSVKAAYAGDDSFNASQITSAISIIPASTSFQLNGLQSVIVGDNYQYGADISTVSSGAQPTGAINFYDNGIKVPGTPQYFGSAGTATQSAYLNALLTVHFSTSGVHNITASYGGDGNYAGAPDSTPLAVSALYSPAVTVTGSSQKVTPGSVVTLTALVDASVKNPAPTGTINFIGNPDTISGTPTYTTVTDAKGNSALQATVTITVNSTEYVTIQYSGDTNYSTGSLAFTTIYVPDFSLRRHPRLRLSKARALWKV
jgi:subtilase family serine protease